MLRVNELEKVRGLRMMDSVWKKVQFVYRRWVNDNSHERDREWQG